LRLKYNLFKEDIFMTLQETMADYGLGIHPIIHDGRIHRFCPQDGKSKTGWYVAFQDGDFESGAFGCWKSGVKENFCNLEKQNFTKEQKKQYAKQMARMLIATYGERIESIIDLAVELGADYVELANSQYHGWALHNREQLMLVEPRCSTFLVHQSNPSRVGRRGLLNNSSYPAPTAPEAWVSRAKLP
jgi:hypothetical protein